jgi:hypothetical protein
MALKYYFDFTDVEYTAHRVEIYNTAFSGDSTEINGSCSLEYSETKDTLEPVRGSGLQIDLDANSDLTFYDLYSEEERTFSVVYKRDNVILFNGWLSPEGIYESLVSDKWVISLDCTDGLGFLGNLSYVEDATGLPFIGKQSALEIITNCLKRTKTPQNILTSINIYYNGLTQTLNPLDNVYFNANRFLKEDDGETIMNCEEVLKSVLEPFGAVITAYKGEWLIYKPNSLFDTSSQVFFAYDSDGVALGTPSRTINFTFDLGSQINNYYPHHANANQQKTIKSAIGAYRINYKYGRINYFNNEDLVVILTTTGQTTKLSTPFNVNIDFKLNFNFKNRVETDPTFFVTAVNLFILIQVAGDDWFYNGTDSWIKGSPISINLPKTNDITYELPPIPQNGVFYSYVDFAGGSNDPTEGGALIGNWNVYSTSTQVDLDGENHTFERILKPSTKVEKVKEVFVGDESKDAYIGTIYKADQITPTSLWTRYGASETKPLLRIMGEERMKMYGKPLQVYKGDVYGYFNYLSIVTINGLTGKFMPTTYSYSALTNLTSLELIEVLNTDILTDIDYKLTFDYGNVVEPTIKG